MWNIATSRTCLRPTKYENFVNKATQKRLSVFFKVMWGRNSIPKSIFVQCKQIASVLLCKWFMNRVVMEMLVSIYAHSVEIS